MQVAAYTACSFGTCLGVHIASTVVLYDHYNYQEWLLICMITFDIVRSSSLVPLVCYFRFLVVGRVDFLGGAHVEAAVSFFLVDFQ